MDQPNDDQHQCEKSNVVIQATFQLECVDVDATIHALQPYTVHAPTTANVPSKKSEFSEKSAVYWCPTEFPYISLGYLHPTATTTRKTNDQQPTTTTVLLCSVPRSRQQVNLHPSSHNPSPPMHGVFSCFRFSYLPKTIVF